MRINLVLAVFVVVLTKANGIEELGLYIDNEAFLLDNYDIFLDFEQFDVKILPTSQVTNKKQPVVRGRFQDTLHKNGWGVLDIETNARFSDQLQAYYAGFLEGYLTAEHISNMAINSASTLFEKMNSKLGIIKADNGLEPMPPRLLDFFHNQEQWTIKKIRKNLSIRRNREYDFFFHLALVMDQYLGLMKGYNYKRHKLDTPLPELDRSMFQMLQAAGDLNDLIPALYPELKTALKYDYFSPNMSLNEIIYHHGLRSSCSAIVKILPDNSDLLFGHNTWFSFSFTDRIYKHYVLNFNNAHTASHGVSFSSYPGMLVSMDDYYTLSSGLMMIQTSNEVLDKSVYEKYIKYESLLAWQRVRVASALSHSGEQYFEIMKRYFSGTYANQYMVLDLKKFTPKQPLKSDTLWIIEEMPGLIVGTDETKILSFGYWSSYNVPFHKEIFIKSGYQKMIDLKKTNHFSHALAPRAKLFKQFESDVTDIETLKRLLRRNDYKRDKYSKQNPSFALCSRYDLLENKTLSKPYGCYDTKVSSFLNGARDRVSQIISRPTDKDSFGAKYIKPFSWKEFEEYSSVGLPREYKFKYLETKPYYIANTDKVAVSNKSRLRYVTN